MILSHVVAASTNGVIGRNGGLPWRIPEDLKFFKEVTSGHAIVMGRKTFETLPKALPNRLNIVVTRDPAFTAPGATVVPDIDQAIRLAQKQSATYGDEIFIVGGGEIYRQTMDQVDRIYLTRIHEMFDGDAHYPDVRLENFKLTKQDDRAGPPPFSFLVYDRK